MNTLGMSYQEIMTKIDETIKNALSFKNGYATKPDELYIIYSAYEEDEYGIPKINLNEIPFKGKIKFVNEDETYESEVYDSPTWLDIAVIANTMIMTTKDFQKKSFRDIDIFNNKNGVAIATLIMEY